MSIIIPNNENQYIEFKSEAVKAANLAEEIVAFANSEGGELWLGVEDDGTVSGLSRSYEEDVVNICRTACIPPIQPQYESLKTEGRLIARVLIPNGKDKPYYTNKHKIVIKMLCLQKDVNHIYFIL